VRHKNIFVEQALSDVPHNTFLPIMIFLVVPKSGLTEALASTCDFEHLLSCTKETAWKLALLDVISYITLLNFPLFTFQAVYYLHAVRRNMHLLHLEIECQGEGLPAIASSVTRSEMPGTTTADASRNAPSLTCR
jgi:hypothetical protein